MGGAELAIGGLMGLVMVTQGIVGIMLRKLNPAARIPAIAPAAIGLIGFPVGTLISVFFLIILCRAKGKRVLSPGYAEIRAATPHIKYKTPVWIWIFLIIIILAVLAANAIPPVNNGVTPAQNPPRGKSLRCESCDHHSKSGDHSRRVRLHRLRAREVASHLKNQEPRTNLVTHPRARRISGIWRSDR